MSKRIYYRAWIEESKYARHLFLNTYCLKRPRETKTEAILRSVASKTKASSFTWKRRTGLFHALEMHLKLSSGKKMTVTIIPAGSMS